MVVEKRQEVLRSLATQFFNDETLEIIKQLVDAEYPPIKSLKIIEEPGIDMRPRLKLMHKIKDFAISYTHEQESVQSDIQLTLTEIYKFLESEAYKIEKSIADTL